MANMFRCDRCHQVFDGYPERVEKPSSRNAPGVQLCLACFQDCVLAFDKFMNSYVPTIKKMRRWF